MKNISTVTHWIDTWIRNHPEQRSVPFTEREKRFIEFAKSTEPEYFNHRSDVDIILDHRAGKAFHEEFKHSESMH